MIDRNLTQKFRVLSSITNDGVGTGTTGFSAVNLYGNISQSRTMLLQLTVKSSILSD